jgi:hypothetical protein
MWAISMDEKDASSLASLRLVPGIEVALAGSVVWLRGRATDESTSPKLAALPVRKRYEWLEPDLLRQLGHRIPSERLPAASWGPLREWLQVRIPVAALPAGLPATVPLRLIRSTEERQADLLLTTIELFRRFSTDAAQVRLERLRFAASADGRVLVKGTPLPPLPGQRFVLYQGVAVPAGFAWQPAVSAEVVIQRFNVSGDALVLWNADDTITRLHQEQLIPVTRSAVRKTAERLAAIP